MKLLFIVVSKDEGMDGVQGLGPCGNTMRSCWVDEMVEASPAELLYCIPYLFELDAGDLATDHLCFLRLVSWCLASFGRRRCKG